MNGTDQEPAPAALSQRMDRDERRLYETAAVELWASRLVDITIDAALPIFSAASWENLPDGVSEGWARRATSSSTLAAMATRTVRVTARQIRSGYGAEAQSGMRRMQEITGHAHSVARDQSGQYAAGWMAGGKKTRSARKAYGGAGDATGWTLSSGMTHANFREFAGFTAKLTDERRLINHLGPQRSPFLDNANLYLLARGHVTTMASLLTVFADVDPNAWLAAVTPIHEAETRVQNEIELQRERIRVSRARPEGQAD